MNIANQLHVAEVTTLAHLADVATFEMRMVAHYALRTARAKAARAKCDGKEFRSRDDWEMFRLIIRERESTRRRLVYWVHLYEAMKTKYAH